MTAATAPVRHDTTERGLSLWILTAGILTATILQTLDSTIVNVALPVIQGNLGATIDQGAWVVTGYIISAVIVIPLTPWLQLRFGRRQYYATAIIGFTIASAFCGLSNSIEMLIVSRIVQGLFGGGLIATAQSTLRDVFPRDKIGASQAIFSLGAIVGPSIGPTLGGWLTDNFSWNQIFFINIVPGGIAAFIILTRLRNPNDPQPIPLDGVGLALLAAGLGSLQFVLDEGQRHDWFDDPLIIALTFGSVLLLTAFALWEIYGTDKPVVDLSALRYRAISAGVVLGIATGAAMLGAIILLPQFLQGPLGFTAMMSGELIFFRATMIGVFTPISARLAGRGTIDNRLLIAAGFVLIGISQLWLGRLMTAQSTFEMLVWPIALGGVAGALVFIPLAIVILGSVPPHVVPQAAAFQSLSFQLGGSLSTAVLITFLARRAAFHQETLAQFASPAHEPFAQLLREHVGLGQIYALITTQASVQSFADLQYAIGILTFSLIPLIFILPKRRRR
jgi:DHA2 family multidrug resistance protein